MLTLATLWATATAFSVYEVVMIWDLLDLDLRKKIRRKKKRNEGGREGDVVKSKRTPYEGRHT
jgi:hypothetical protein